MLIRKLRDLVLIFAISCAVIRFSGKCKKIYRFSQAFTSDGVGVGVVIRSVEHYDVVKIKQRSRKQNFLLHLRFRRLRSSENQSVGVVSRSGRTKPIRKRGNEHCGWFILPLLLPTPTIWFSRDRTRRNRKRSRKKMETF